MRQQVMRPYKRYRCHYQLLNNLLPTSTNYHRKSQQSEFKELNKGVPDEEELMETEEKRVRRKPNCKMENPDKEQCGSQKENKLSIIQEFQMKNKEILSKLASIHKRITTSNQNQNSHNVPAYISAKLPNTWFEVQKKAITEEVEARLSQCMFKMILESEQVRENMFNRIEALEKNIGTFMTAITTKLVDNQKKIIDYFGEDAQSKIKREKFEFQRFNNSNPQIREDDLLSERVQSPTSTTLKDKFFLKRSSIPEILIQDDIGIQQLKVEDSEDIPISLQKYCYKIDEQNNLIDQQGNYILSESGNIIQLSGSQLEKIKSSELIQFVDK